MARAATKQAVKKAAQKPTGRPRQMAPQGTVLRAAAKAATQREAKQAPKPNGGAHFVGQRMPRKEDPRLIQGISHYADDLRLPGLLHCVFVRSPHAHAKVTSIQVDAARRHPGVVAVYTAADLAGVGNVPCAGQLPELKVPRHPPLAPLGGFVRYVGEPVAAVVAEDL